MATTARGSVSAEGRQKRIALAYGITCHALFLAGVGSMIFAMYHGLQTGYGRLDGVVAVVVNGLLILQFPLTHSVLLTVKGRRLLNWMAPDPEAKTLQTTTYALVASIQLLLTFQLWSPSGIIWWQAQGWAWWALTALYGASWAFLGLAILNSSLKLQSGALGWLALYRGRKPRFPDMPTHGLYRIFRHPIYLAFACTLWTVPVWTPDQLALALSWTLYCVAAPKLKERRFLQFHGARYAAYRNNMPYMLPKLGGDQTGFQRNRNIYDGVATQWWSDDILWLRTLRAMVAGRLKSFDQVAQWRDAHVLDLGCAGGFMAEPLAERGAHVTGIDPAEKAIEAARHHAAKMGHDIQYDVGVGEALPYGDHSFDYVVCVDVLEHVQSVEGVLDEVKRVLKPGGTFFFDTIAKNRLAKFAAITMAEDVLGLLPAGTHDPDMFIPPEQLRQWLTERGFQVSAFEGLGPRGIDTSLTPVFGRVPTTSIIYMGHATSAKE
ncbi:MAG: bifunctional 2-polyprenyl-6-hydroxyphenol methylase/3-demethylubiquinol 3-O-methyltransferase UbiG [Pseudomonadota bacterium]